MENRIIFARLKSWFKAIASLINPIAIISIFFKILPED